MGREARSPQEFWCSHCSMSGAMATFAPLVFSLMIIALVWPSAALQRWLPRLLALLVTLVITMTVIVVVGSSVAWGLGRLGHWFFLNAQRFEAIFDWTDWLEQQGIAIAGPWPTVSTSAGWSASCQAWPGRLNSFAGFAPAFFIFVMLGLLEVETGPGVFVPGRPTLGERILIADRCDRCETASLHGGAHLGERSSPGCWCGCLRLSPDLSWPPPGVPSPSRSTIFRFSARSSPPRFRPSLPSMEHVADSGCRLRQPQRDPVHYQQLSTLTGRRCRCRRRRHLRGVLLELSVGMTSAFIGVPILEFVSSSIVPAFHRHSGWQSCCPARRPCRRGRAVHLRTIDRRRNGVDAPRSANLWSVSTSPDVSRARW